MRRRYTFWIDDWLGDALKAIKERDGIPESEQLRRAVSAWVEQRGIKLPAEARRPGTGKRKGEA
jgi:hypothetical protein